LDLEQEAMNWREFN